MKKAFKNLGWKEPWRMSSPTPFCSKVSPKVLLRLLFSCSQSLPKEAPPPLWAVCSRVQPLVGIPAPNPARSPQLVCDHAPLERLCFLLGQEETDKYSWISLSFPLCLLLSRLLTTSSCLAFNTGVCGTWTIEKLPQRATGPPVLRGFQSYMKPELT